MYGKFKILLFAVLGIFFFASCSNDDDNGGGGSSSSNSGSCYIVNQGNWNGNDASLQVYDFTTGYASSPECGSDIFSVANKELLGDVAQVRIEFLFVFLMNCWNTVFSANHDMI